MSARHYIIATAGHVDHGKSSLVKALTGTDPDRLPEEKARKITIDLGFAELNLPNDIHAAIVDVPGHEDFVRNMIAGVGSIDLALLVVAADDGWMPQTEEHFQILEYLDVTRAVVCLTKIDIGNADAVEKQIRDRLSGTVFERSPIVRTSLTDPSFIAELRDAIASELARGEPQRDIGKARLFVDRAFTLRGIGTVVTGTLSGGTLRRGENIFVLPRGIRARIRSMQSHGQDVDLARPGTRVALNLPDVAAKSEIARGDVITRDEFRSTTVIDVALRCSAHGNRDMRSGATIWLHHGTTRIRGRVQLLNRATLSRGTEALARLRLYSPMLAFIGDRFVVRDAAEQRTMAGGIILNFYDAPMNPAALVARAAAIDDVDLAIKSEIQNVKAAARTSLLQQSRFSADEIAAALKRLHQRGEIFVGDALAVEVDFWKRTRARAIALIDHAHKVRPQQHGIELNELRTQLGDVPVEVVDLAVVDLAAKECVRAGSQVGRQSHRAALPNELRAMAEEILKKLSTVDPPNRKQLESDAAHRTAFRFLLSRGEVIEISNEVAMAGSTFEEMKKRITTFIDAKRGATVGDLRQALGSSRRVMVPLLELLDRQGVTRRVGDRRVLACGR